MPLIAEHLTVGLQQDRPILSDLSLRIEDGEFVLVLGSSGSGKSTFALCLNGIVPQVIPAYYTGSLTVNGRDTSKTPVSEMATEVGLVFQDPDAQLIAMYVEDEIVFGPENLLLERDEIGRRLKRSLEMVGMSEFKDVHTWSLSGGQKQRVAIGSVLSMQPSVLVLDEPTSNLDPEGSRSVFGLLAHLRRETDMTIIAIEHKVDELIEYVDRLLVFDQGRIIVNGPPREMIAQYGELLIQKGINVPQVSELVLEARRHGRAVPNRVLPLTVGEAVERWPGVPLSSTPSTPGPRSRTHQQVEPIVRFEKVWFSYPNRPPALMDINLEIFSGEFIAIVGQNGAGKTTLTKLMVGLLKPSRGRLTLAGEAIPQMPIERLTERVGYVFQYPDNQLVTDTVFDEVAFSMRIRNVPEGQMKAKVEAVLETVELAHQVDRHPLTLSMGEKRRLSVATMLVLDQDILILDEPTMGMDRGHIISIMKICRRLQERGRTILMVTHDMRIVADWADRVIAMAGAQIRLDSQPREFFLNEEILKETRLAQLPICPWRDCRHDGHARCRTCPPDFLGMLLDPRTIDHSEVLR
ncbi:MAG TPA: ABC transporter ATP-binding protein [Chloroflexi bacterium]|nr:ABC transporter ATP-binding protein [Chloroflexota bacterium]